MCECQRKCLSEPQTIERIVNVIDLGSSVEENPKHVGTLPVVWSDFLLPWSYCWSITSSSVQVTSLKKSNKSYRDVRQNFLSWDMIHPKGDTPVITEHDYDSKWQLLSDLPGAALGNFGYWMLISLIWIQKYRFVLKKEGKLYYLWAKEKPRKIHE